MEEGPNSKARRNAHAVLLTAAGYSYRQTGRILFVGEGTIGRVVRMYKKRPNRTPEAVDAYRQNLWS
jgi:transposase